MFRVCEAGIVGRSGFAVRDSHSALIIASPSRQAELGWRVFDEKLAIKIFERRKQSYLWLSAEARWWSKSWAGLGIIHSSF